MSYGDRYGASRLDAGGGSVVVNADGTVSVVGDTDITGSLGITTSKATLFPAISVTNTDTANAAGHARIRVTTGGASSGDPFISMGVAGVDDISLGLDNSDSDKFKMTRSNTGPSSGTEFFIVTLGTGLVEIPGAWSNRTSIALTNAAEGNTGALTTKTTRQVVAMGTGATAVSTSISVPSGARLLAVALNVDVAIVTAGDNTWEAAFSTG